MAEKQDNINKNRELLVKQGGFRQVKKIDNSDKNTIHLPRHSSFTIMQGFAKWGRVRHNMVECLEITTVWTTEAHSG